METDRPNLVKGTEGAFTEDLAEFSASIDFKALPRQVSHQAERCLLDTLAAAVASAREEVPVMLTDYYRAEGGKKEATVLLSKLRTPALNAALVNGAMAHCLELDDGNRYAAGHPGAVVIPAALAAAELTEASGTDLLSAIVAGYEVFIRLGSAINPEHLKRGFHTTGTCGPFGAAAAAGRIFKLTPEQMESAFGLAGLQGAGLLRVVETGATAKPIQVGRAAQSGLFSALLAKRGLRGPDKILEGSKGFIGAMAGSNVGLRPLLKGLGVDYSILQTYVKPYPTCRHMHAAIDCASHLRVENAIAIPEIEEISVETYQVAIDLTGSIRAPVSLSEARFSMAYAVALVLSKESFSQGFAAGLSDPRIMKLARKVRVSFDAEWETAYPRLRGCTVLVRMRDGTVLQRREESARGEPETPMSDGELGDKFIGCSMAKMSEAKAKRVIASIMSTHQAPSISKLMASLA